MCQSLRYSKLKFVTLRQKMVVPKDVTENQILSGHLLAKNRCAKLGFIALPWKWTGF